MTIRVFVGVDPNYCDAESQSVLEWSLRKHSSEDVEIEWMRLSKDPESFWYSDGLGKGWNTDTWVTPFSGFRFGIPAFCGFEGRAIYMDSDVIVLGDIAELWNQPMKKGTIALAKGGGSWRYCVSLWDCKEALEHFPALEWLRRESSSYQRVIGYLKERPHLTEAFCGDWNNLDGQGYSNLSDPQLKAIHYTTINTQLQLKHAIPRLERQGLKHWFDGKIVPHPRTDLQKLFDDLLEEAGRMGYGVERYVQEPPFGEIKKKSLQNYNRKIGSS